MEGKNNLLNGLVSGCIGLCARNPYRMGITCTLAWPCPRTMQETLMESALLARDLRGSTLHPARWIELCCDLHPATLEFAHTRCKKPLYNGHFLHFRSCPHTLSERNPCRMGTSCIKPVPALHGVDQITLCVGSCGLMLDAINADISRHVEHHEISCAK